MIEQTVLKFKLARTDEHLTSHAGLALFGEFAIGAGIRKHLDKYLPKPGSGKGYLASEHVYPLLLMLTGGGRSLEDLREIREDRGLREILGLKRIPSSDATGDWLRRSGDNGCLEGLESVNRQVLKRALKRDGIRTYTLDIDATGIEAEKETAKRTYKGYKGTMPIVGHLAENGLVIGNDFREGNASPGSKNLEFLKACENQLPKGKRLGAFRADSASYQAKIINHCEAHGIRYAIGGDLDQAVKKVIKTIRKGDWRPYQGGRIGESIHSMEKTDKAFRLIVIKRPYQGNLFDREEPSERTTVIVTNREESAEEVVRWYNQRGQCSENRIKELKIGYGMERMPCGQLKANAVFFRIGVLAYNLGRLFTLKVLKKEWWCHQVQTLRWKLFGTSGKVIYHGRSIYLKVSRVLERLFARIRRRSWEYARGWT